MSNAELHPLPRWTAVAREQFWAAGIATRHAALVLAVFLALFSWLLTAQAAPGAPGLRPQWLALPIAVLCALLPQTLWRHEDPWQRAYFRSMPVAGAAHHLIKNAVGWVWMLMGMALVYLWALVGATVTDAPVAEVPSWQWAVPAAVGAGVYLLSAAVATAFNGPGRWLMGIYLSAFVLARTEIGGRLGEGRFGFSVFIGTAIRGVPFSDWLVAAALWLGLGMLLLLAASYIHRDL